MTDTKHVIPIPQAAAPRNEPQDVITTMEKDLSLYKSSEYLRVTAHPVGKWISSSFEYVVDDFPYDDVKSFLYNYEALLSVVKRFPEPHYKTGELDGIREDIENLRRLQPLTAAEQDMLYHIRVDGTLITIEGKIIGQTLDSDDHVITTTIEVSSVTPFLERKTVRLISVAPTYKLFYVSELAKPDESLLTLPLVLANIAHSYVGGYWVDERGNVLANIHFNNPYHYKSLQRDGNTFLVLKEEREVEPSKALLSDLRSVPVISLGKLPQLQSRDIEPG